jgi:hypothetical protein
LVAVTQFAAAAITLPSFTTTAPNGPPAPVSDVLHRQVDRHFHERVVRRHPELPFACD